jgi:hypothetical protein
MTTTKVYVEAAGEAFQAAGRAHEILLAREVDVHAAYAGSFSVEVEDGVAARWWT